MDKQKEPNDVKIEAPLPNNVVTVEQLQNTINGLNNTISIKDKESNSFKSQIESLEKSFDGLKTQIQSKGYDLENMPDFTEVNNLKAQSEIAMLKMKVATDKKIPLEFVSRLQGTTLEELQADADSLAPLINGKYSTGDIEPPKAPKSTVKIFASKKEKKGHFTI